MSIEKNTKNTNEIDNETKSFEKEIKESSEFTNWKVILDRIEKIANQYWAKNKIDPNLIKGKIFSRLIENMNSVFRNWYDENNDKKISLSEFNRYINGEWVLANIIQKQSYPSTTQEINDSNINTLKKNCPLSILYSKWWKVAWRPWWHMALQVNWKVYSYWRWWEMRWAWNTKWDGCLFVFDSKQQYAATESSTEEVPLFWTTASQRDAIIDFYSKKIENGKSIEKHTLDKATKGQKVNNPSYVWSGEYIIDDYNVFDQNCTTITLNALWKAWWALWGAFADINAENSWFEDTTDIKHTTSAFFTSCDQANIKVSKVDSLNFVKSWFKKIPKIDITPDQFLDIFYKNRLNVVSKWWNTFVRLPENLMQAVKNPKHSLSKFNLNNRNGNK